MFCLLPAEGQETLHLVDSLSSRGEVERARSILEEWWKTDLPDANRNDRQQALWLRGVLTVDPELASLDFRRLALSYPGGLYSDDALSRLGLLSVAKGDLSRASEYYGAILLDYPTSPKRRVAEEWLTDNSDSLQRLESNSRATKKEEQITTIQKDMESIEQKSNASLGRYAIQVGAFANNQRARDLAKKLSNMGFEVRIVGINGTTLSRVRIGRFQEREGASRVLENLRKIGQTATLVDDVLLEIRQP